MKKAKILGWGVFSKSGKFLGGFSGRQAARLFRVGDEVVRRVEVKII